MCGIFYYMMDEENDVPARVVLHLRAMTEGSDLPRTDAALEAVIANWREKRAMFERQTELLGMERIDSFSSDETRGAILLTYSGSLLAFGPKDDAGRRWFEYASIKLRNDVPPMIREVGVVLTASIEVGASARFDRCSIKHSSDVLRIAVCPASLSRTEEDRRLREASVYLTNGFVKLNRTLTMPEDPVGHFTARNMIRYVAGKNAVSQDEARRIIEDYLAVVEAGLLLGERVPLGQMGKLSLGVRPARKARLGRNPASGEQVLIPAKAETTVPKISFSARLRERAAAVSEAERSARRR